MNDTRLAAEPEEAIRMSDAPLPSNQWLSPLEKMPEPGRMVLFILSGEPKPHIGYYDTPESWWSRGNDANPVVDDLKQWWTELHDEDDWWEHEHVLRWCYVQELPL